MTDEDFRAELLASMRSRAEAHAMGAREAFVSELCERLRDAGELPDIESCPETVTGQRGRRLELDGFAFDEADDSLHLVGVILDESGNPAKINLTDIRAGVFNRLEAAFEQARSGWLTDNIEESRPLWALARRVQRSGRPSALRLHAFTDRIISERLKTIPPGTTDEGILIEYQVWDVSRLRRIHEAGSARDDLVVDLTWLPTGGLPVLPATVGEDYDAYLGVIPGRALAEIYLRYGSRLLEGNVRTFLGRGGAVNKGIATTLSKEPSRFFAYNNGIAATASAATLARNIHGIQVITELADLQIVNGAQTTASLASLHREGKLPEIGVYVPLKLSVVGVEVAQEIVPLISRYSNSQNAVRASDFFANHEFHRRTEQMSRRILAPARGGSQLETHWYYERARGQYLNDQAGFTPARRDQFQRLNPKSQVITKTELAKIETCFDLLPDIACKGAEKAFVAFAERVAKGWQDEKARSLYGDDWFRSAAARLILFRAAERLVSKAPWYASGTRAQVVAYATAKLANMAGEGPDGGRLDYLKIWSRQSATDVLEAQLELIGEAVMQVLLTPPQAGQNVGEWAKQQACRERVFRIDVARVDGFEAALVSRADTVADKRSQRDGQRVFDGLEAMQEVIARGGAHWQAVRACARRLGMLTPDDDKALSVASLVPKRLPNDHQALRVVAVQQRCLDAGAAL